jgi:hypothetical protein
MFMQAKLIVRKPNKDIAQIVDLSSLDEANVDEQVRCLRKRIPSDYEIDQSQIEAARNAMRAQ